MDKVNRKLCDMVDRELEKLSNSANLESAGVREALDKLAHTKKSLLAIEAMEGAGDSYERGNSYNDWDSGARGRGSRGGSGRGMSRDGYDSYGSGRENMMRQLEAMRMSAASEADRQNIDRWMRELNN